VLHKCGEINPGLGNDGIGIHNHIISWTTEWFNYVASE
jgi:hypothetical protein